MFADKKNVRIVNAELVLLRHITSGRGACVRLATSFGRKELIVNKVACLHVHRLSYLIEQIEKNWPIGSGGKPALSNRFPSATIGGIRSYDDDESFCLPLLGSILHGPLYCRWLSCLAYAESIEA